MPVFVPFRGITYNFSKFKDISSLVTPPYDVITEEEQEFYHNLSPYNVIRLILGKKKVGDTDWDNRYTRAAEYFRKWQESKVLVRSNRPSFYLTCISYKIENVIKERWGIIGLVKIDEDDSRVILPHERTFSAYKEDRLRLMKACNAQFSQIFGLYSDPNKEILEGIKSEVDLDSPILDFEFLDKTRHKMWIVESNFSLFRRILNLFKNKKIIIADGHHRYETTKNFRNLMRMRFGKNPPNRSYEFVMMYLSNMDDEGLTVLPSHRLIRNVPNFNLSRFLDNISRFFDIIQVSLLKISSLNEIKNKLHNYGISNCAIAFFCYNDPNNFYIFSLKTNTYAVIGNDLHPALKKLDVIILSRLIFQHVLGFSKEDMDNSNMFYYTTDIDKAISLVKKGNYQMAFLLNPTKIDHIKDITENSLIMPRKSTYFYPKILTGLVFNKVDPDEIIQFP